MNKYHAHGLCTLEPFLGGNLFCIRLNDKKIIEIYSGTPFERPPPLERPLDNVNLNINVLISTPDVRPSLLKGHFSDAKGVALQEGFNCKMKYGLEFEDV